MSHLHVGPSSSSPLSNHPHHSTTYSSRRVPSSGAAGVASNSSPSQAWDPVLRDRQARGKDPYSPLEAIRPGTQKEESRTSLQYQYGHR